MFENSAPILARKFIVSKPAQCNASCTLSGYLVIGNARPDSVSLWLTSPNREVQLRFSEKPTKNLARQYRQSLNSKRARIESVKLDVNDGPWVVQLRDEQTGTCWHIQEIGASHYEIVRLFREVCDFVSRGSQRKEIEEFFDKTNSSLVKWGKRFGNNDPQMLETRILLNFACQKHPARTLRYMRRLRKIYCDSGRNDRYIEFVLAYLSPLGVAPPTSHGFSDGFQMRATSEIWAGIASVLTTLRDEGLECFINSGTLLGAVREGDLIGHDDDVDLAVLLHAKTFPEVALAWAVLREHLNAKGILDVKATQRETGILKLNRICGVQVDLFPAWIDYEERVFVYPHTAGELAKEDLLPLEESIRPGIWMPRRAEEMLKLNYGPDWCVPDPLWQFPWSAAKKRFGELLDLMQRVEKN